MGRYILGRLLGAIPLLLGISLLSFILIRLAPGDPVSLIYGPDVPPEDIEQIRAAWGLDKPLPLQYLFWLGNFLHGDLGRSYADGRPVLAILLERIPLTLQLTFTALGLALLFGVIVGIISARYRTSLLDSWITVIATACYSIPAFWLGLLLILLLSVKFHLLPSSGVASLRGEPSLGDALAHLAMPAFVLSLREFGRIVRFTRSSLLDVIQAGYIRTARAKGLSERAVLVHHALRNALSPLLTLLGLAIPGLLGSSIVIESVYAWPGIGRLAYEAAIWRNYPVIMGITLLVGALVILGNLLADIGQAIADPRVRLDESA